MECDYCLKTAIARAHLTECCRPGCTSALALCGEHVSDLEMRYNWDDAWTVSMVKG
jgi:hypothetical protein